MHLEYALPAEEEGINGPGARSNHRQNGAENRLQDGNPWIVRMREVPHQGNANLNGGCQGSRQWSPQTDQKKYPRADSDGLQDDCRQRRVLTQIGDPKMD
jgi:hypothetical protein